MKKNFYSQLEDFRAYLVLAFDMDGGQRKRVDGRLDQLREAASEMSDSSHDFGWESAFEYALEVIQNAANEGKDEE